MFEASLSTHAWLEKLNNCTLFNMLDQGLVGRALATLMFSPTQLKKVIVCDGKLFYVQPEYRRQSYFFTSICTERHFALFTIFCIQR